MLKPHWGIEAAKEPTKGPKFLEAFKKPLILFAQKCSKSSINKNTKNKKGIVLILSTTASTAHSGKNCIKNASNIVLIL